MGAGEHAYEPARLVYHGKLVEIALAEELHGALQPILRAYDAQLVQARHHLAHGHHAPLVLGHVFDVTQGGDTYQAPVLDDWRGAQDVWLQRALNQGYRGLRIAGDTRGLGAIGKLRIKALCTYSVEHCDPSEVLSKHDPAYVKRQNGWERIAASPTL